jgi:hypothetical protein
MTSNRIITPADFFAKPGQGEGVKSISERMAQLSRLIEDARTPARDKIAAIRLLNEMDEAAQGQSNPSESRAQ